MINRRTFLKFAAATPAVVALPVIAKSIEPTIIEPTIIEPYKELYVEVSSRRSGKSTRLVNNMLDYIKATGEDVYLITFNVPWWDTLVRDYVPINYHNKVKRLPLNPKERKDLRCYYDEADFIPKKYQSFRKNAYYTGTPRSNSGYLKELVKFNNNSYAHYVMGDWDNNDLNDFKQQMTTKEFSREILGRFI